MSKAAIYRSGAGEEKPTLVLDEVGWVVDLQDERQGILCGGFEVNGYVEVCEGEGADITTRRFSTYCPKAFGLIGKLTPTLVDRSICVPLDRKLRTDKVERLRRRDNDEFAQLRRRCLRWANDNAKALAKTRPLELEGLNDRALDFWEPLLTIADRAGGSWPKVARDTALALSGESKEDGEDVRVELLKDIREAFGDADVIRSADLVTKLTSDAERPWADWKRGRSLTQKQLGGLLRPFGICIVLVGSLGAQTRGYRRWQFEEAWAAYCPGQNPLRPDLRFRSVNLSICR
jgi:putative DNA primase/helicase